MVKRIYGINYWLFNRCKKKFKEGNLIEKEYFVEYASDGSRPWTHGSTIVRLSEIVDENGIINNAKVLEVVKRNYSDAVSIISIKAMN